jgi:predicted esterase
MSALDIIKRQEAAKKINLVGYSGGAYIALVLSALRDDIQAVTTYAGLLDPPIWTRHHGVSPLNLAYDKHWLLHESSSTPFIHYCGTQDDIIPCVLNEDVVKGWANHTLYRLKANHSNIGL